MYRFFKCNRLGGFRLTDLNKKIQTDEYFYFDVHTCDASRGILSALKAKWMLEVSEQEASQFISIPKTKILEQKEEIVAENKIPVRTSVDAKIANSSLESRQAGRSFKPRIPMPKQKEEDKPVVPNFNAAERRMRERQADIMTKGPDELLRSPVQNQVKRDIETLKKDVVADLAKELIDNSQLITPNFDEKKQDAKIEVKQEIEKRVRRRRKLETTSQEA